MNLPDGLWYTKEHEWARIEGKRAYVGITDYAQSSLGDITYIELPQVGASFKQFEASASVESVKAVSSVYAPLSGKVVGINELLTNQPELVNKSPYQEGYLYILEFSDLGELKNLMDSQAYRNYLSQLEK